MNLWTTTKGLVVAFMLASATGPAMAASDEAQQVDKMRAKIAAYAEKTIQAQGGSRIPFKVDAGALREAMLTDLGDDVYRIVREGRIPFAGLAVREGVMTAIRHRARRPRAVGVGDPRADRERHRTDIRQPHARRG
jgi:preprotein translocase subunit SecD